MTLTLEDLQSEVTHALGGEPAAPHTPQKIVNRAGTHLYAMHEWRFANRAPYTLQVFADDPQVPLPPDIGRILRIASNGTQVIHIAGVPELSRRHLDSNVNSSTLYEFYGTVIYPAEDGTKPHIYVTPTPDSSDTDVARLWYRAGWVPLVSEEQVANVPAEAELLLVDLCREIAKGYDEDNLKQRLQGISQSMLYLETKRWDGQMQPQGTLENGYWTRGHPFVNTYRITDATAPT
jgi:hypothetical protein